MIRLIINWFMNGNEVSENSNEAFCLRPVGSPCRDKKKWCSTDIDELDLILDPSDPFEELFEIELEDDDVQRPTALALPSSMKRMANDGRLISVDTPSEYLMHIWPSVFLVMSYVILLITKGLRILLILMSCGIHLIPKSCALNTRDYTGTEAVCSSGPIRFSTWWCSGLPRMLGRMALGPMVAPCLPALFDSALKNTTTS